ncbi:MAG: type VI secretion system baseplate subunit TssF [Gemmatimonadota bacterium]
MRDDLLHYYEQELAYLRKMGAGFAQKYPKVASRLELEANKCEDPHVERLLEGVAFLAARVHLRIDDDFPEVSEALLNVVFPHYVQPIPSLSLVQFHLDPEQGQLTTGLEIPRESALYSRPVGGVPCRFRTCYDTTLWPVEIRNVEWRAPHQLSPPVRSREAVGALSVQLESLPGLTFAELEMDRLRLHLSAESGLASTLYELLLNNCEAILLRDPDARPGTEPLTLAPSALTPVGFEEEDSLLPPVRRSLGLYGVLQEYFTFPDKFFFLDLSGLERLKEAQFGTKAELVFLISPFERADRNERLASGVGSDTIRLGCTPIVNLFEKTSEPVLLNQRRYEYPVVADARRQESTGIFSVDSVAAVAAGSDDAVPFRPFFSLDHRGGVDGSAVFWQVKRKPSGWRPDQGTAVYLSFVDLGSRMVHPEEDAVTARLTCFNEDLPSRLPFGDSRRGDFELPGGGPVDRIVALVKPTPPVQPPLGKPQLWRLISQLSLNYTSLVDAGGEGLRELLRLHNFADSHAVDRQIEGIHEVSAAPCYSRIESEHGLAFARGHRVEVEFDEEEFAGGGVYLFASVLERFLGRFVSLNSFSVLAARTRQRKELMKEWNPRAGSKALL